MITLAFPAPSLQDLRAKLWDSELESAAVVLCVPVKLHSTGGWRLLVKELHIASTDHYEERTSIAVRLSSQFCLPLEKRAKVQGWSVVYVHTHPHADEAAFSPVDDRAEAPMADYLRMRCPDVPHASLLLSRAGAKCRVLGTSDHVRVVEIGGNLAVAYDVEEPTLMEDRFDRQVRAFGSEGQRRLSQLTVAIVGLGGTGSLIAQQLAHLGVRRFVLVDDDMIESTNLNRVVGATPADVGRAKKIDVAARVIIALGGEVTLRLDEDVTLPGVARQVIEADVVFNCTDTYASRHVLNQAAYQYLVPMIDMGVSITVDGAMQAHMAGHVKMLAPGLACLWCAGNMNSDAVRAEMMTAEQRAADPYVQGAATVAQPAVISLSGVVTSVAVTMLLAAVAGVPSPARFVYYDGNRSRMNALSRPPDAACVFCGPGSTIGWGDTYPLPSRRT